MRRLLILALVFCVNLLSAQTSWNYDVTDISHNIMIPGGAGDSIIEIGDLIGVFYESGDEMICAGYSEWTGNNIALTAFGASFTFNGFTPDQEMLFFRWDSQSQTAVQLYPVFNSIDFINGNTFLNNGLSGISYFNTIYAPGCADPNYVEFNENAIQNDGSCEVLWSEAYQSITSSIDSLEINLENFTSENDSLYEVLDSLYASIALLLSNDSLNQEPVSVSEVDIPLYLPQGWGMFGYTCYDSMSAVEAFMPIADKVILIKDNNGAIYFPEYNFNRLGPLMYSRGYQIYLTEEVLDFSICPTIIFE